MLVQRFGGFITANPDPLQAWRQSLGGNGLTSLATPGQAAGNGSGPAHDIFALAAIEYSGQVDGEDVIATCTGAPVLRDSGGKANGGTTDFETIVAAICRHGPRVFADINGTFSIAVIRPSRREALLAVDRFSVENLFYVVDGPGFAFANRTHLLKTHPACGDRFTAQAIYNYVYFHCLPGPDTGYVGMTRLLPGECIRWHDSEIESLAYWRPSYAEDHATPTSELSRELNHLLRDAVSRRLTDGKTACFLSGGLDSSTITGLAAASDPNGVTAYTIGFDDPDYDETDFARAAATHFDVPFVPYYMTPADVAEALPDIIAAFDGPFGNASAVPAYYCAKLAADNGMSVILAGDGGDELFGGNERYAKQLLFEKYTLVPAWARTKLIEPAVTHLRGPLVGKASRFVEQALVPLPDRLMTYNVLDIVGAEAILTGDFLASIDRCAPLAALRSMYREDPESSVLNRMLELDLRITLADSDLPKVSRMCELAGIPVAYPMLDETVFELAARLPSSLKIRGRDLRHFFKHAFADLLPQSTLNKSKHGFGLPFGVWLKTDPSLQDIVATHLGYLERSGILRPEFRTRFLGEEFQQHPGYYGTLLWVLTCLGMWLQHEAVSVQ